MLSERPIFFLNLKKTADRPILANFWLGLLWPVDLNLARQPVPWSSDFLFMFAVLQVLSCENLIVFLSPSATWFFVLGGPRLSAVGFCWVAYVYRRPVFCGSAHIVGPLHADDFEAGILNLLLSNILWIIYFVIKELYMNKNY